MAEDGAMSETEDFPEFDLGALGTKYMVPEALAGMTSTIPALELLKLRETLTTALDRVEDLEGQLAVGAFDEYSSDESGDDEMLVPPPLELSATDVAELLNAHAKLGPSARTKLIMKGIPLFLMLDAKSISIPPEISADEYRSQARKVLAWLIKTENLETFNALTQSVAGKIQSVLVLRTVTTGRFRVRDGGDGFVAAPTAAYRKKVMLLLPRNMLVRLRRIALLLGATRLSASKFSLTKAALLRWLGPEKDPKLRKVLARNTFFKPPPSTVAALVSALPNTDADQQEKEKKHLHVLKSDFHAYCHGSVKMMGRTGIISSNPVLQNLKGTSEVIVSDAHPCILSLRSSDLLLGRLSLSFSYSGYKRSDGKDPFSPLFADQPRMAP